MTIESVLDAIQNFRSALDQWGVTAEPLIAVAFLAGVMFVLSLREVMTWFLRVHTVRDEVRALRAEIAELKGLLTAHAVPLEMETPTETTTATPTVEEDQKKDEPKPIKAFRLDH